MKFQRPQSTEGLPVTHLSDEMTKYVNEHSAPPATESEKTVETKVEVKEKMGETIETVNVRKDPDSNSKVITTLYKNSLVKVVPYNDEWYQITSGSFKGGYIRKAFIK